MYGYQPPAARRLAQTPEQYADGGLVARMKSADAGSAAFGSRGLSQLRDMVPQMAAMGYPQQAAAPAPAPAPVSDPRVAQLQAMIPKMEAMGFQKRPLTPQMLARGGMVRGPGTGTSDSIATEAEPGTYIMPADSTAAIGPSALEKMGTVPVRLSDGEFKIPPEQVMALGAAVLKLLKDTTHTPVNGEDGGQTDAEVEGDDDDGARGLNPADRMAQMPEQMYADGGMVEDDVTRVGNSYSGGNVGGNITVNGAAPGGTFSMGSPIRSAAPAPQAAAPTNPAPSNPAATPAAPVATAATAASPATAAPMGWAERNAQRNLQVTASSIMDSPERRMAQAALAPPPPPAPAATPATAAPAPSTGFQPAAQRMGTVPPVGQPSLGYQPRRFADGGMVEDDLQKRLMQIPSSAPAGWTGGGGGSGSGGGAGGVTGSWEAPQAAPAPAPAPAQPAGALTRAASMSAPAPAVQAMGELPANPNGGQVSAQSMGAADSLARRGAADAMAQMPAPQQTNVQAPMVRHSGNDWQARNDLRNALVSASSITNNGGRFDQTRGRNPAALAYQSALATDNALQASEPGLAAAAMKENSETNRSAMRERGLAAQALASERGAMDRTLITERGNNTRAGIAATATLDAARLKAQQEGKAPPGYRFTASGNMEAIPGGPADLRQNKEGAQQAKDTQDIFSIINEARPLMERATGSLLGTGVDKTISAFGGTTDGAAATAQLKALQGAIISKMPKMSGPQSDKDVQLYREMAGQIGDSTIPTAQRSAAMNTIEQLNMKYLPQAAGPDDLAQVPSGAWFRAPDGSVRRKP